MDKKEKEMLLAKVRSKLKEQNNSRDPAMFKPPQVKAGETVKFKFVVLPGLKKGDKCASGTASKDMGDMFYIPGGQHWINKRPYPCPRLFDNQECPWCSTGFNLLSECDIEEERKKISSLYLSKGFYVVNAYFPAYPVNPTELHNKVLWYPVPKTVFDKMEACLMREDAGTDKEDPQPFGMFYDPEDCLVFQLEVTHKSGYNNYESSKFLQKSQSLPADEIPEILAQRHDLWTKYPERNPAELEKMLSALFNGTKSESSETKSAKKESPKKQETKAASKDEDDVLLPSSKKKSESKPIAEDESSSVLDNDPELQDLINGIKDE